MTDDTMRRPSGWLRDLEAVEAIGERAALATSRGALSFAPRGDGHGVLVLPGFITSDPWTWPARIPTSCDR